MFTQGDPWCCIPTTDERLYRVRLSLGLVAALTLPVPIPTQAHPSAASVGSRTGVRGEVRVSPLSDFIGERTLADVFIEPDPGIFSPDEVVRRALSRLRERNWWLLSNNCEHCTFVIRSLWRADWEGGRMAVGRGKGSDGRALGGCGHSALLPTPHRIPLAPETEPPHRCLTWTPARRGHCTCPGASSSPVTQSLNGQFRASGTRRKPTGSCASTPPCRSSMREPTTRTCGPRTSSVGRGTTSAT